MLFCLFCLWLSGNLRSFAQDLPQDSDSKGSAVGKSNYASLCAGCHGLDGKGSERAPNIATIPRVQGFSDAQLANTVSDGIPGTGMPGFHTLGSAQIQALVSYVRTLQGKMERETLPGDPARGRELFFGKAACSACHLIDGHGGFIGPDLTAYGSTLPAKTILDALLNPNRIVPRGYGAVTVVTRDGSRITGVLRNEDNFSVQLLTEDGSFRFFQRSDLQKIEFSRQPLMPSNYGERLSQNQLDDIVSYLIEAASSHKPVGKDEDREDDEE